MLTHLWKSMLDWRLFGYVSGSCKWLNVLLPRCTWDLRWLAKFSSPSQRAEDSACSRQGSLCRVACQECTYAAWFWVKSESSQQSPCKLSNSIHFILKSEITKTIKNRKANVSHQDHLRPMLPHCLSTERQSPRIIRWTCSAPTSFLRARANGQHRATPGIFILGLVSPRKWNGNMIFDRYLIVHIS